MSRRHTAADRFDRTAATALGFDRAYQSESDAPDEQNFSSGDEDSQGRKSMRTTSEKAMRYDPGRVRLGTAFRDYWGIVRSRYADFVFKGCVGYLLLQLCLSAGVFSGAGAGLEALAHLRTAYLELRLADAVALLVRELGVLGPVIVTMLVTMRLRKHKRVYLLEYSLFEPPPHWRSSKADIIEMLRSARSAGGDEQDRSFTDTDIKFMEKVLANSGTGEGTAWPPGICNAKEGKPIDDSLSAAREEATTVLCGCLGRLFAETGVKPKEVGLEGIERNLHTQPSHVLS